MPYGQYQFLDNKNLIGIWDEMYEPALGGVWANKIGTMNGSDMGVESYGWLGAAPGLEELTDDSANEEQLGRYTYFLKNIEYAKSLKIKELDMRRDKIGQLQLRIGEMSEKAAEHWNVLTAAAIINGATSTGLGYDGVPFYSTSHPEAVAAGGNVQKNLLSSSDLPALDIVIPTAPTPYEAAQAINQAIGYFYSLVDDKNYPMNGQAKKFKILVGTIALYAPISQACTLLTFAQGTQNPLIGLQMNGSKVEIEVELVPQLSTITNAFHIFRMDGRVKAILLQSEVDVTPAVSDKGNDEYIKFRRFLFSVYASRAVGYLRWQSTLKCVFS